MAKAMRRYPCRADCSITAFQSNGTAKREHRDVQQVHCDLDSNNISLGKCMDLCLDDKAARWSRESP